MTQKSSDSSSLSAKCGAQIRVSGFELGSQPQTFVPGCITQRAYASLQDSRLPGFHDKAVVNLMFPFPLSAGQQPFVLPFYFGTACKSPGVPAVLVGA